MKLSISISIAAAVSALTFGLSAIPAKADYANCNRIGNYTNCHGSDGSSYRSNRIGDNFTNFSGRDRNGNSYNGNCTRIGNYVNCSSY